MKTIFTLSIILLFGTTVKAQAPEFLWQNEFGSDEWHDLGKTCVQSGSGYIILSEKGYEETYEDFWLIKLNNEGELIWERNYGGSGWEIAEKVIKANDGGYVMLGRSYSNDGDVGNNYGQSDIWIIKVDESGEIQWSKNFGGSLTDTPGDIIQDSAGGYLVIGTSNSTDFDISNNLGFDDFWLFKISEEGEMVWEESLGGSSADKGIKLVQNADGNLVLAGYSSSEDGDVSNNIGHYDLWICKLDENQNILWENSYGSTRMEITEGFIKDHESLGGYIAYGYNDTEEEHPEGWVIKIDDNGNELWKKEIGLSVRSFNLRDNSKYVYSSYEDAGLGGEFEVNVVFFEEVDTNWNHLWRLDVGYFGWFKPSYFIYDSYITEEGKMLITGSKGADYYSRVWTALFSPGQMGIDELEKSSVLIYPNPVSEYLNLSSDDNIKSVAIHDFSGRTILNFTDVNAAFLKINLTQLVSGNYNVKIETEKGVQSIKLLKK